MRERFWKDKAIVFIACLAGLAAAVGVDWPQRGAEMGAAWIKNAVFRQAAAPAPESPPPAAVFQADGVLFSDRRDRVAPLSISTPSRGGGFYVKLLYSGTKQGRLELFVNAGSQFATQVALGKYDIVYATGKRWLGRRRARQGEPFWPSVSYYRLCRVAT